MNGLTDKGVTQILAADLLQDLADFWCLRQDRISDNTLADVSEEYKTISETADIKYHVLLQSLGEGIRTDFMVYADAKNDMDSISNAVFYKRGFCDGIKSLLQMLML